MKLEEITREELIRERGYRDTILGDKFSLYISNYPATAFYLGHRIGNDQKVLAELCCSIGITLEYLTPVFKKTIGVDIDAITLSACRENLISAGLIDKVTLLEGDICDNQFLKSIRADVVIYDIPYWYPHTRENKGNLVDKNPPLIKIVNNIRGNITSDIVIFAPKESEPDYFAEMLGECECEKVFINDKHDRNHIYLGGLIHSMGETEIRLKTIL